MAGAGLTTQITLDAGEMAVARDVATMRRYINTLIDSREIHFSRTVFDDEVNGVVAELGFAKWQNVYPDLGQPHAKSYDCVVRGRRVDVKAVTKRHHQLIAPIWKTDDCVDIYVLGVVEDNGVEFIGWVHSHEFIRDDAVTDIGHGPTYVLPQNQLHPFAAEGLSPQERAPA